MDLSFMQFIFDPGTLPGAIFYAVVFSLLAFITSLIARRFIRGLIRGAQKTAVDPTAGTFISQLSQVAIFVIVAIFYFNLIPALRALGTAILATAGVASIVLGLAAQNTLGNVISGISILLYRQVRLGDEIKVYASAGDETGVVESITLGFTTLRTQSGERIIIPNSVLASTVIVNRGRRGTPDDRSDKMGG